VLLIFSAYFAAYYTLFVRPCCRRTAFPVSSHPKGDITDEKFFRKPHDSDCTQFSYLYKGVPTHGAFFALVSSKISPRLVRGETIHDSPSLAMDSVGNVLDRISARFTYRIYIPRYCGIQAHAGSNERRSRYVPSQLHTSPHLFAINIFFSARFLPT